MKGTRKFALLAAGIASALALSACGGQAAPSASNTPAPGGESSSAAPDPGKKLKIALVSKGFQHQFWQAVKQGAEQKAQELGVEMTFDGPASETEVDNQLNMLQAAIDTKPDAIGYASLDPDACKPLMDKAKEAGIPVVQFDAACNSDVPLTLAATDGKAAAAIAADKMAELIGGKGKVAIISHSQINQTGVDRRDGFADQIKAKYPDIEIVDVQYGDGDHLKSAEIAKAMINAHPDLAGIYATNEGSAIGAVNAGNELKLEPGKLIIIGFDSGKAQIDAIKSGLMAGAITQDPIGIGAATIQSAVDAINGKDLPKFIDTGAYWYDKTNIDDPKIAAVLYE